VAVLGGESLLQARKSVGDDRVERIAPGAPVLDGVRHGGAALQGPGQVPVVHAGVLSAAGPVG
jgi:hypothetical protein